MVRISDARMSGTSYGACVLHVAPESHVGGPLALVRDGDLITLDVRGPHPCARGVRRGAGAAAGGVDPAGAEVRTRLRRAVLRAHHPGQRGLRLRVPVPARQEPGAERPLSQIRSCKGYFRHMNCGESSLHETTEVPASSAARGGSSCCCCWECCPCHRWWSSARGCRPVRARPCAGGRRCPGSEWSASRPRCR